MTRRQRTTLFSIAVAIFLVVSPAIILYAAGYRIDLAGKRLVKTGGLSLTASPQPVNAYVDGELESSNNFVFRNIFISNLLPRNYDVKITKDGYYSWQKTLQVVEGQVTEALNIILFPQHPKSAVLAGNVDALFLSPDNSRALFTQNSASGESLLLQEGQQSASIQELVPGEIVQHISWTEDNSLFLAMEKLGSTPHLFLGDASHASLALQDLSSFIPVAVLSHSALSSTQFSQDKKLVYFLSSPTLAKQGIYVLHLDTHALDGPLQPSASAIAATQDGIYVLLSNTTEPLAKCSFDLTSCTEVPSSSLDGSSSGFSSMMTDGDHLIVLQNKNLYVYRSDQQDFSLITDGVNAVLFSPDQEKMAIEKDHEVSVYWFKDIVRGEQHKAGDMDLLLRISEKISGIAWMSNPYQYLAVEANDALRMVELDGRDVRNIVSYPESSSAQQIGWQKDSANLLLVHANNLIQDFAQTVSQ